MTATGSNFWRDLEGVIKQQNSSFLNPLLSTISNKKIFSVVNIFWNP
jgi:hypothetical protein